MIFVGVDWADAHHDVCVLDEGGEVRGRARVSDGVAGVARLHALIGEHADEASEVVVGIEIDRGLLVGALVAAGYRLFAINPLAVSRYRDRDALSGAKSDPADAKVLADLVRTDRHNHRPVAGDSDLVEGIKVMERAHQNAIWSRQRQINALRSALREYYPAALEAFGTMLDSPTRWPSSASPRHHSSAGSCRSPRWPRRCAEGAGNATSRAGPRRFTRSYAASSYTRRWQ